MLDNQLTTIYEHPLEQEEDNSHDVARSLQSNYTLSSFSYFSYEMSMFVRFNVTCVIASDMYLDVHRAAWL